jgi:hypothetical protein
VYPSAATLPRQLVRISDLDVGAQNSRPAIIWPADVGIKSNRRTEQLRPHKAYFRTRHFSAADSGNGGRGTVQAGPWVRGRSPCLKQIRADGAPPGSGAQAAPKGRVHSQEGAERLRCKCRMEAYGYPHCPTGAVRVDAPRAAAQPVDHDEARHATAEARELPAGPTRHATVPSR